MIVFNLKKGALVASFFFVLNLSALSSTDNRTDIWYQIGYDYSQQGHNIKAFEWMLRAANGGHIAAQNNIGLSYLHGLGVKKNNHQAFNWFEKAAKQGLNYAQSELAMLHYQRGNTRQAYEWWLIAARANDEYAQFNLASLFLEEKQIKQAYYWFKQAEKNQHPQAKIALEKLKILGKKYVK